MGFPQATRTALLGQAVGDAFGAPFEYDPRAGEMAMRSMAEGRYLDSGADLDKPAKWARLAGLYTDDTQQALVLLHAASMADDLLDAEDIGARFRSTTADMYDAWVPGARAGVHRGTGRNFREAVRSGKAVDTAGLGAAMRVGPVATLLPDLETVLSWTVTVSRATTTHPIALTCAALFAARCHAAAHDQEDGLIGRVLAWLDSFEAGRLGLEREAWLDPLRAIAVFSSAGEAGLLEFATESGHSNKPLDCAANGFALTGLPWVLHHGSAAQFPDALIGACASGGDADTVGAMAGCLAALRLGIDSIPGWMIDTLLGAAHLRSPEHWDPIASERPLTQQEEGYRRELALRQKPPRRHRRHPLAPPIDLSGDEWVDLDEELAALDADDEDEDSESGADDPLSQLPDAPAEASAPAPVSGGRMEQLNLFRGGQED